ncbi:hypothetical protein K7432_017689 [Basidiobolus ranarum]|uniref:Uncharacterized protein n=1 Tax=Basidiobolus ranarum TaxID=34480 RepID=A0ABR2VK03_9FUNG
MSTFCSINQEVKTPIPLILQTTFNRLPNTLGLVVIGLDIFTQLGFNIGVLPASYPELSKSLSPDSDHKPEVISDTPEQEELSPPLQAYTNSVKVAIQPAIERNQIIQKNSFCTILESLVVLEKVPGETTWRRQYPIPHMVLSLVDEVVHKWADNGIVTQAPVNTTFNCP